MRVNIIVLWQFMWMILFAQVQTCLQRTSPTNSEHCIHSSTQEGFIIEQKEYAEKLNTIKILRERERERQRDVEGKTRP